MALILKVKINLQHSTGILGRVYFPVNKFLEEMAFATLNTILLFGAAINESDSGNSLTDWGPCIQYVQTQTQE